MHNLTFDSGRLDSIDSSDRRDSMESDKVVVTPSRKSAVVFAVSDSNSDSDVGSSSSSASSSSKGGSGSGSGSGSSSSSSSLYSVDEDGERYRKSKPSRVSLASELGLRA